MSGTVRLASLLSVCVQAAEAAACIVRRLRRERALGSTLKAPGDFVTEADLAAQRLIVATLRRFHAALAVVGEEDVEVRDSDAVDPATDAVADADVPETLRVVDVAQLTVWVDPVDATNELVAGNPAAVIVLIGVALRGTPVAGVMHQVFADADAADSGDDARGGRTVWGVVGGRVSGLRRVAADRAHADDLVLATTRSHSTPEVDESIRLAAPARCVRIGGAGFKALMVAEGDCDVYVMPNAGTKRWDTAAPEAILRAIGARLTALDGSVYSYESTVQPRNDGGIVAAFPQTHDVVVRRLASLARTLQQQQQQQQQQ